MVFRFRIPVKENLLILLAYGDICVIVFQICFDSHQILIGWNKLIQIKDYSSYYMLVVILLVSKPCIGQYLLFMVFPVF